MRGEHARKSWSESRTHHNVDLSLTGLRIKGQQCFHVAQIVRRANDMNSLTNKALGEMCLRSRWTRENHNVDVERIIKRTAVDACALAEALRDHLDAVSPLITKHDIVVIGGHELSRKTRTNRADTKNSNAGHVSQDPGRTVRASHLIGVEQHPIRGAERRRRQAPPCRWQPWPVGSFSSWG